MKISFRLIICIFCLFSTLILSTKALCKEHRLCYPANGKSPVYKTLVKNLQHMTLGVDEKIIPTPIDISELHLDGKKELISRSINDDCDLVFSTGESLGAIQQIQIKIPLLYVSLSQIKGKNTSSIALNGTGVIRGSHDEILRLSLKMLPEKAKKHIGIIYRANMPFTFAIARFKKKSAIYNNDIIYIKYKDQQDLPVVMQEFKSQGGRALLLFPPACPKEDIPILLSTQKKIKLPVIAQTYTHVKQGALGGPTINFRSLIPQLSDYAIKIFRGRDPKQLPVKFIHYNYAVNLSTASKLEIDIPQDVLANADIVGIPSIKRAVQKKPEPLKKGAFVMAIPVKTSKKLVDSVIKELALKGYVKGKNLTIYDIDFNQDKLSRNILSKADVIFTAGNTIPTLIKKKNIDLPICFVATRETASSIPASLQKKYTGVIRSSFGAIMEKNKLMMNGKERIAMIGRKNSRLPKLIQRYKKIAASNGLTMGYHLFSDAKEISTLMKGIKKDYDYILLFTPGITGEDITQLVKW